MIRPHTRPATEADVFAMEHIMRDAFSASYATFMPEAYVRQWYDDDTASKSVKSGLKQAGVVTIKEKVVGFIIRKKTTSPISGLHQTAKAREPDALSCAG